MSVEKLYACAEQIVENSPSLAMANSQLAKSICGDPAYLTALERGGFVAFKGALRFFGRSKSEGHVNVEYWNDKSTWKYAYGELMRNIWCFAEDVFGNQFVFFERKIHWFQNETAKMIFLCDTLDEWASKIIEDSDYYSGASLLQAWLESNPSENFSPRFHLCPITPFTCNGKFEVENVFKHEARKNMTFWANFAIQIKDLPEGTPIKFEFK